jgi:glycosyltransferase involved in cell wall biosynthesis
MSQNVAANRVKIVVVIPAFRAAPHLERVVRGIPAFVAQIVVVDDCSPDDTAIIAIRLAGSDQRVVLVQHPANQGVGGAMLSGYQKAVELGADVIVKMDSDDQMDPAYLPALIAPILSGQADYTKGNRFLHTRQLAAMPWLRRVGNTGLSFLTKLASGYWNMFDPTNGYTAIHAAVVPLLDTAAIDRRYFFETSMFLELGLLRAVVKDVYIPARYGNETSHLSERRALREFPPRLLRALLRRVWVNYFLRDFGVLSVFLVSGIILLLFGLVFGGYHWILAWQLSVPTPVGTIMLAVLPAILGVQFLLQACILDVQNVPAQPVHLEVMGSRPYQSRTDQPSAGAYLAYTKENFSKGHG